jgi:hypothetical protein
MKWKERDIEVVEGLLAYRRTFPIPVESTLVADIFDSGVEEITEIDELGIGTIALDRAVDAQTIQNAATQLGEGVSWIEPVVIDHGAITPNDPLFSQQWALKEIKAEAGWDHWIGPSSDSTVVDLAILDSGIRWSIGNSLIRISTIQIGLCLGQIFFTRATTLLTIRVMELTLRVLPPQLPTMVWESRDCAGEVQF